MLSFFPQGIFVMVEDCCSFFKELLPHLMKTFGSATVKERNNVHEVGLMQVQMLEMLQLIWQKQH